VKKEMTGILRHWQMRGFLIGLLICGGILNFRVDARAETKPSLAVLPFLVERMEDPGRGAVCPICKGIYQRGEISPGSQNILTRFLYEKMEANGIFKIIPMKKLEEALST
jgi:hypothetical protein